MLIRFVVENLFSFDAQKEFNTFPNNRLKTLAHHKYKIAGFNILKLSSIYGANGAGKSNLIKALYLFRKLLIEEEIPFELKNTEFKFFEGDRKKQTLVVEFFQENTAFYYGLEFLDDLILTEELYLSGLGKTEDRLVFERKTDENRNTEITFSEDFEKDEKSQLLKSILLEEFVKPDEPVLKLIANRDNKFLQPAKKAFAWFSESLQIIMPESRPRALPQLIDRDEQFKRYAEDIMSSFNLGITALSVEKKKIEDFFGEDDRDELDQLIKEVEKSPVKMLGLRNKRGDEIVVVKEDGKIWVKSVKTGHTGKDGKLELFELREESDGTIRLLDFIPAFKDALDKRKVFIIDEIERSIHPLLIKELLKKFSLDSETKGQIIFTTHESNLLDQQMFRQDEIWFVEKDKTGATDLYSLSDFREHKTIDIRKGYLNGRYGAIPFLANLHDLNWHQYDTNRQAL